MTEQMAVKLNDINDYIKVGLVHEIHTSERKSFRGCRRRWDWVYRDSFYPRVTAKPLEFGIAYHVGMQTYYNPATWSFDNEVKLQRSLQEFTNECNKQRREAMLKSGQVELEPEIEADYNERVELGRGMISYYISKVAPLIDKGWTPVKVEIEFMLPIPNPETKEPVIWCKCGTCTSAYYDYHSRIGIEFKNDIFQGLPVVYSGRIDMIAKDEDGNYWIFDWKTAGSIPEDKSFLDLDDQIGSYVWALRRLGINVQGFVYHEQLKGFPVPPKKNQRPRNGCWFSVAKNQHTDHQTYLETVSRYDTEAWAAGNYDNFLNYLQLEGTKYYDRREVHKTDAEVNNIEFNIGLETLDMLDPKVRLYPNGGRFSCGNCAFKVPCIEKNNNGDYLYALETVFERKEHYYKEIRNSTEGK